MAKVFGLGGVFFKSSDEAALRDWYTRVLGLEFADWGGVAFKPDAATATPGAATVFCPFKADTDHFAPSDKDYMFNLMVDDLDGVLARCRAEGVEAGEIVEFNGRFAHIMDPEGRKIELWEPKPMPDAEH
ncbi:MAG: VOC family protein [Alphaproteobacteria bacterium]|nr:VOC family protein [Alphaproteobacteria bacterium]